MLQILGRNNHTRIISVLAILAVLYLGVITYKRFTRKEGFSEVEGKYTIKREDQIYDDYYASLYDKIYEPNIIAKETAEFVIKFTHADKTKSVMLDCGSGTGELTNYVQERGFNIIGVERSEDMIEYALNKYPEIKVKQGDVMTPMLFDKATFSHILCIGVQNPIYQTKDKNTLFRNFYHWLIPHGYLVIQLVDRNKFNPIPPSGRSDVLENPQELAKTRFTDTEISFVDFQYKSNYDFSKGNECVKITETFTDGVKNVRQNEVMMYMNDVDDIIKIARECGFIVHGQMNLLQTIGDEYQYIFLLERI